MLTERIPINLITGIIVYHAHKTLESCQEAFILRLYRQKNKTGFIKGLSDNAVAFTYGFCQVQRMMRNLFVKKLFLWPRFQADVIASLNKRKPDVVELRVGMTPAMQAIQLAILDIVASCVREIKRVNPSMEMDDLTVENLIARSFEKIIKFQLDPIWHQLGAKTRHLVSDIKTLRTILQYLTQYDCVTFYSLVKSVRDAGTMTSQISDWFFLDAAETLFLQAKARVYGSEQKLHKEEAKGKEATTKEATLRMEESPKWAALSEILVEIGRENNDCGDLNSVLVIAEDDRICGQLTEYLCCGGQAVLRKIYRKSVADKDGLQLPRLPSMSEDVQKSPQKTKKKQSKPKVGDTDSDDVEESDATEAATAVFPPNLPNTVFHPLRSSAFALQQLLLTVEPKYIVLYDVNIATVREIEMYQATRAKEVLRVYFLMYEDSVDEQRYLTALRREKDAFEFLIREKNVMVVPEEQDGKGDYHPDLVDELSLSNETVSSRKAGGAPVKPSGSRKVIVDLREFRSDLPSLIHRRGISVQPVTIEVGDYILTPDICVERKSLNDLIGSLNSGRLYNQAQSMCRYYKRPVLLIEFSQNQPFCLQGKYGISSDISSQSFVSKLILLTMHFPRLRILWCQTPYATAEIFDIIKQGKEEPSVSEAQAVTEKEEASGGKLSSRINPAPQDFLLHLPGVNLKNQALLTRKFTNLVEMFAASEEELTSAMGNAVQAKLLWESIHRPTEPKPQKPPPRKFRKK
ncbi:DNA repair endonuclease XPF isoform X2 [Ixodes scapularis]|nr:DNA repair endonuclease XPF isoform X2 [Ixodes scapularis]